MTSERGWAMRRTVFATAALTEMNDDNPDKSVRTWIRTSLEKLEAKVEKGRTIRSRFRALSWPGRRV